jgi:hypothetical protein
MLFQHDIPLMAFNQWLRQDKENRLLLKLSLVAIMISFLLIKFYYPYPNFMPPDSNSYIEAAFYNHSINFWAIGYSKYLRFVSCFTNSHFLLVLIQYLLLQASLLYFLFSLRYLLLPGKWLFRILISGNILNPLLPHISNFVSSDCLFATLSLVWATQLLWIIYLPNRKLLFIHSFILLMAFMVRYNALFYPLISIGVIALSRIQITTKLFSSSLIILLIGIFIGSTQYQYYNNTGTVQYSAFGGWQMAANALYGYAYSSRDAPESVPERFRQLHTIVNRHMDSIRHLAIRPDVEIGIYYLWDEKSPLKTYLQQHLKRDDSSNYFNRWAQLAPLYSAYGRYLIQRHPLNFIKHFVWPNLTRYYSPPIQFMGFYWKWKL